MSRRRRRELRARAVVREVVLERDGGCRGERLVPHVSCAGPVDVHEVVRRSQDALAWLNPDLCIAVCRAHHSWLHDHPQAAREVGLLRWSWEHRS